MSEHKPTCAITLQNWPVPLGVKPPCDCGAESATPESGGAGRAVRYSFSGPRCPWCDERPPCDPKGCAGPPGSPEPPDVAMLVWSPTHGLMMPNGANVPSDSRNVDYQRVRLDLYPPPASPDVVTCTCASIQAADGTRHFRECPLRAKNPEHKLAPRLACSRCGVAVVRSYEPGRCYADDCEPAEKSLHDEAEPWNDVHGTEESPPASTFRARADGSVDIAALQAGALELASLSKYERPVASPNDAAGCVACDTCNGFRAVGRPCQACAGRVGALVTGSRKPFVEPRYDETFRAGMAAMSSELDEATDPGEEPLASPSLSATTESGGAGEDIAEAAGPDGVFHLANCHGYGSMCTCGAFERGQTTPPDEVDAVFMKASRTNIHVLERKVRELLERPAKPPASPSLSAVWARADRAPEEDVRTEIDRIVQGVIRCQGHNAMAGFNALVDLSRGQADLLDAARAENVWLERELAKRSSLLAIPTLQDGIDAHRMVQAALDGPQALVDLVGKLERELAEATDRHEDACAHNYEDAAAAIVAENRVLTSERDEARAEVERLKGREAEMRQEALTGWRRARSAYVGALQSNNVADAEERIRKLLEDGGR